jgi:hypothetical protein
MFQNNLLGAASSDTGFKVGAVTFDGSNDYMSRAAWSGTNSSNELLVSYWILNNGDGVDDTHIGGTDGRHNIIWTSDTWYTGMYASSNARIARISSSTSPAADTDWHHILFSYNAGTPYLYIDNANVLVDTESSDAVIDFDLALNTIGSNASAATLLDGDLAEFYYNPGTSLDFSDAANRAKFAVDGKPIFLGLDGSLPTGSAPVLYLHQDAGEAPANFKDNKGTGGDYTITGTLTTAPTSPTD